MSNTSINHNNLAVVIEDPRARKTIYGTFVLVALGAAATTVGFAASEAAVIPEWLHIANSVIAFLGAPVAGLAAANSPTAKALSGGDHSA